MPIRCLAVDDEPLALGLLAEYIEKTPFLSMEGSFHDPILALEQIRQFPPELVFLDINMPDLTGMELSRMLPEQTRVIFTTAYNHYALESYQVDAIDYLLKPFSYQEFLRASHKAQEYFQLIKGNTGQQNFIFVKADYKYHKLLFDEILFVENVKDYVRFHLLGGRRLMSLMNLKTLEETLPDHFMKVHRSYIVNLHALESVERGQINIEGHMIPIATRFRAEFQEFLNKNSLG